MRVLHYDLFPTPVTYYEGFLPPIKASKIKDYILTRKNDTRLHRALIGDATSLHGHKDTFIEEVTKEVDGCNQLYKNIMVCVEDYASLTGYSEPVILNSWFNIQNKGSLLKRHMHAHTTALIFCSGVLYINIDETSADICFDNPNPYSYIFTHKNRPLTKYNLVESSFKPKIGDLILFPSWLIHSNSELNESDSRIAISFNIGVK